MSIRPIDMQAPVQRSYEVNKNGAYDSARPDVQNQHFAEQLDKEIQHNQQSVKESNKSEENAVDKDGSNKNGYNNKKKRGNKKEKEEKKEQTSSLSMLDIRV